MTPPNSLREGEGRGSSIRADADDRGCSVAAALLKLAERCEREQPSWGLSVDIELTLVPGSIDRRSWDPRVPVGIGDRAYNPPAYTSSLDAAVTLVPEGWVVDLSSTCQRHWRCAVARCGDLGNNRIDARQDFYAPHIKTGPLALCAAALRARAHEAEIASKDLRHTQAPQSENPK